MNSIHGVVGKSVSLNESLSPKLNRTLIAIYATFDYNDYYVISAYGPICLLYDICLLYNIDLLSLLRTRRR